MSSPVVQLIRAHQGLFLDRIVARIMEHIPRYALVDPSTLRLSCAEFLDDMSAMIENKERRAISDRIIADAQKRIDQGFTPSDYLGAILQVFPVARELVRDKGPKDPAFAKSFSEFEAALHEMAAVAASVFASTFARQLESKNQELNTLNQRLQTHERVLQMEATQATKALRAANEFNARIISSLTSGLGVIETGTQKVIHYTHRMEEILGIPAEKVLGRPVLEAFAGVFEIELRDTIQTVKSFGRLPMTKTHVTMANGRIKSVYMQAQRMLDEDGHSVGTVVIIDDVTERDLLIDSFSRYVSRDLLQRLLARGEQLGLEGERKVCTIFFADIRGFTRLAETLKPEELQELLNSYFRVTIDTIIKNGGFIDKFVGDKVMAIFSQSDDAAVHATAATEAAQEITRRLRALNRHRREKGLSEIEIGIGLNTGEVLLGNIGSEERMDFTAIGDTVNIADRLQGLARGGSVVLGEETARLCGDKFKMIDRGAVTVKGRSGQVQVFELVPMATATFAG